MKAKFEICLDEQRDLEAFDYGLKSLMVELGGGSFHKHPGPLSNETVYDYECANDNVRLTMNSVGTLAARHHLMEHMQRHELLSN
jgi:hypothetical protein